MDEQQNFVESIIEAALRRKQKSRTHSPTRGFVSGDEARYKNTMANRRASLEALRRDLEAYRASQPGALQKLIDGITDDYKKFIDIESSPHKQAQWLITREELEKQGYNPMFFVDMKKVNS